MSRHLDGIAHDSKGRIKVVGYVNAEELRERLMKRTLVNAAPYYTMVTTDDVHAIIDELAG